MLWILGILLAIVALVIAFNFKKLVESYHKLKGFFGEVGGEMQKVTWPTQDEVINSTILVVVTTLALTIMCWVVDYFIGHVVRLIF